MATEENWEDIIRSNYTDLLKIIDTENGLFGELKGVKVFTPIALKTFWDCKDTTERIDRILRSLQKKDFDSFKKFCSALSKCEQGHVVKQHLSSVKEVLRSSQTQTQCDAGVDPTRSRGIPAVVSECFKEHWNNLISSITADESLLAEIDKRKIFTPLQLTRLRDTIYELKRTELILNLLERGSEKQFADFCDALHACNQSHIINEYFKPSVGLNREQLRNSAELGLHENPATIPPQPANVAKVAPLLTVQREVYLKEIVFTPCSQGFLEKIKEKIMLKIAYKCDSKPRGRAVIINNEFFSVPLLQAREGAGQDSERLEVLFKQLNFETVVHSNLSAEEILKKLREESRDKMLRNHDMFVLFLMSHGIQGEVYGLDGKPVKTKEVMEIFGGKHCPYLVDKPKLIFIQACQGELKTAGVSCIVGDMTTSDSAADDVAVTWSIKEIEVANKLKQKEDINLSLPLEPLPLFENDAVPDIRVHEMADMALIYATVEGYVAWRRRDTGSLFVQTLISVLCRRAHEKDLMSMITEVFSDLHDLEVQETHFKQIGEKRDSLRREVYLLP